MTRQLSECFDNYRTDKQAEVDKAQKKANDLVFRSQLLENGYRDLMSDTDYKNKLFIWNDEHDGVNGTKPRYEGDPLYHRVQLIDQYITHTEREGTGERSYVLCLFHDFLLKILKRIKERKLDEKTYTGLSGICDIEIKDTFMNLSERLFYDELGKQEDSPKS